MTWIDTNNAKVKGRCGFSEIFHTDYSCAHRILSMPVPIYQPVVNQMHALVQYINILITGMLEY